MWIKIDREEGKSKEREMRSPTQSSATVEEGQRGGPMTTTTTTKPTPCCSKVGMKRGPWTAEEDEVLASFVRREGEGRWRTLPKRAGLLRCGKSCRLRWMNYLRPSIKRGPITPDEEDLILRLHRLLGNRWSLIAGRIPGRTDNEIKNYWNTHLSKKLIKQGIDPRTHRPFTSSTDPDPSVLSNPPGDPVANPNSIPSVPQELGTGGEGVAVRNDRCGYFDGLNLHHDHVGWQSSEAIATQGNQAPDGRKGMDGCTGDVFSDLFDYSFINEDIFMQQQNKNNNSNQDGDGNNSKNKHVEMIDLMGITSVPSFGLDSLWEDDFTYFG